MQSNSTNEGDELRRKTALLEGLKLIFGISSIDFCEQGPGAAAVMRLEIGTSKARVSLDQGMRVTALELDNAPEGVNARDLLEQAQVMPSPQDLRFIVSYISSANERATALLRDMTEIRKHCIAKHISTKQIEVCFSNQTVACLIVHDSYPDVPNGIYIASIRGEDNQLPNVFENIREAANAEVMHSVIDAVKFLKKKMDI